MYKFKKNFLCAGILDHLLNVILNHFSNVILEFIPRIHAKHSSVDTRVTPEYDGDLMVDPRVEPEDDNRKRMCLKPEDDHKRSLNKGLDVLCQCTALLERRVQSGTRVRKAQAVTRQTNPIGRSMIEMLGVLAIVGVLSVGGIAGYSKAMEKFKINKTIEQVAQIATNIRTLYAQQKSFSGLNNTTAIQMGVVPDEMATSGGTESYGQYYGQDIATVFGGNVFIRGGWDGETFAIELRNITKNACVFLATADWGATDLSGIVGLIVGYASDPGSHIFASTNKEDMGGNDYVCSGDKYGTDRYIACSGINFPVSPAIAAKVCEIMPNVAIRFHK